MSDLPANLYAEWRARYAPSWAVLRDEAGESRPTEKLLQHLWQHQRLRRDELTTTDERRVHVLHPGFLNHEAGPDFCQAVIQFGDDAPVSGDVEIDLDARNWRGHGHFSNPAYVGVILHVVWNLTDAAAAPVPTMVIRDQLDAPLKELEEWAEHEPFEIPASLAGRCAAVFRDLPEPLVTSILKQAAESRFQRKGRLLHARARQAGCEQAFWEGMFAALGYKQNVWPMRRLAEVLTEIRAGQIQLDPFTWQSRLLGIGGLLPDDLHSRRPRIGSYLRRVWDFWWRERTQFERLVVPRSLWRFHGMRPANQPPRRLALASHWLSRKDLLAALEEWFMKEVPPPRLVRSLMDVLQVPMDEFWSWHWTFRSKPLGSPQPLLGPQRATDLAVNVVLPWFWMRAVAGGNDKLRDAAVRRYFDWPAGEDNAVLRLARRRMLGTGSRPFRTAAEQQGMLQVARDFCGHSNALCERCPFPELARELVPRPAP